VLFFPPLFLCARKNFFLFFLKCVFLLFLFLGFRSCRMRSFSPPMEHKPLGERNFPSFQLPPSPTRFRFLFPWTTPPLISSLFRHTISVFFRSLLLISGVGLPVISSAFFSQQRNDFPPVPFALFLGRLFAQKHPFCRHTFPSFLQSESSSVSFFSFFFVPFSHKSAVYPPVLFFRQTRIDA